MKLFLTLLNLPYGFIMICLIGWPAVGQQNYAFLKPSKEFGTDKVTVHIRKIADGGKLAIVGDTLYRLTGSSKVVWSWNDGYGTELSTNLIVHPDGDVYITGADNLLASIDLKTGKENWHNQSNGTAPWVLIGLYGRDKFIAVKSLWYYRHYFKDRYHRSMSDTLSIFRGDEILWSTDIPSDAKIKIRGKDLYATTKYHGRTVIKKMRIPVKLPKTGEKIPPTYTLDTSNTSDRQF